MLQLHDKTRFRICLAGFAVSCVLPTLLVAGWCLSRHLPGCARAEAEQLGRQLGMNVKLEGLRRLRPGVVLYEGLELTDPETYQAILRCRLLEIARRQESDQQGQRRAVLVITATQPEVESAAINRIWQCLQRTMEGSYGPLEADLRLSAAEVTLRAGDNSQTMTDVEGALETLPGGTRAEVHFRLAGVDTPEPAGILIDRNRQVSPPASAFHLDTGGVGLPCNVLALGISALKPLGSRCRFRGHVWASETPEGWNAEVTGQLLELDLGGLISDHFPYKLSGSGDVTIQSARFRGSRLEEGSASVTAGPGTIDRSLLVAAIDRLGLAAGSEPLPVAERVRYQQLALLATLDTQGFQLRGRCDKTGTVLSDGRHRLLGETPQPQPVAALVQTLVPQSAVQVPASRQTDWLLRHLPVPEVVPLPGAEAVPPQARLRLKKTLR
jgi:hypothetical protein